MPRSLELPGYFFKINIVRELIRCCKPFFATGFRTITTLSDIYKCKLYISACINIENCEKFQAERLKRILKE